MSVLDMSEAFNELEEGIVLQVANKSVVDYEASETPVTFLSFSGVLQPMPSQKLIVKPEGERRWKWWTLSTKQNLNVDDVLKDGNGMGYRVMSKEDWSRYGFYKYELTQAPTT